MLQFFAFAIAAAVMMVFAIAPTGHEPALAETAGKAVDPVAVQTLEVEGDQLTVAARESYKVIKPPPVVKVARSSGQAPAAGVPDPGSAKATALRLVTARGWGTGEYNCLVSLWNKESNWNMYASNPSSGAYGIPQALPGSKMASAGADWATNATTQIQWGLGYIANRYGTPCGAWGHSQSVGWY